MYLTCGTKFVQRWLMNSHCCDVLSKWLVLQAFCVLGNTVPEPDQNSVYGSWELGSFWKVVFNLG